MLGLWTPTSLFSSGPAVKTKEDVVAYAARIEAAWNPFYNDDFKPWVSGGMVKEGLVTGEVLGSPDSDPKKVAAAKAKIAVVDRLANDRQNFKDYVASLGITGPSWPDAWAKFTEFEATLKANRKSLSAYVSLTTPAPGNLADPNAVIDSLTTTKVALYAVGGIAAVAATYAGFRMIKKYTAERQYTNASTVRG